MPEVRYKYAAPQPTWGYDIRVGDEIHLPGRSFVVTQINEGTPPIADYIQLVGTRPQTATIRREMKYSVSQTVGRPQRALGVVRESIVDEISLAETLAAICKPYLEEGAYQESALVGAFQLAAKLMYPEWTTNRANHHLLYIMEDYLDDDGKYIGPLPTRDHNDLLHVDTLPPVSDFEKKMRAAGQTPNA